MRVATFLIFIIAIALLGFLLSGNLNYDIFEIDTNLFLIPIVLLFLYVLIKSETIKLRQEISSKILTAFLCVMLLSSTFTGFANFTTPAEVFAEELTNSTFSEISYINQTSSVVSSLDPLDEITESSTSLNSTSVNITEISYINQTSSVVSSLDPLDEITESSTSLNSTSVNITEIPYINQTSSVVSSLDPLDEITESSTSLNSTSVDTNSTSTEPIIDTNSTSTEPIIETNSTSTEPIIETNSTSTEPIIETNSTSTEPIIDTNSTSTEPIIDTNSTSTEPIIETNSTSTEPIIETNSTSTEPIIETNSTSTEPIIVPDATVSFQFDDLESVITNSTIAELESIITNSTIAELESVITNSTTAEPESTTLELSGQGDFLQIANVTTINDLNGLTVTAWVNPDYSSGSPEFTVVSKDKSFSLTISNDVSSENTAKFSVFDGIKWTAVESTSVISEDWSFLSSTFDGELIAIFVDGKKEATQETIGVPTLTANGKLQTVSVENITSNEDIVIGASVTVKDSNNQNQVMNFLEKLMMCHSMIMF